MGVNFGMGPNNNTDSIQKNKYEKTEKQSAYNGRLSLFEAMKNKTDKDGKPYLKDNTVSLFEIKDFLAQHGDEYAEQVEQATGLNKDTLGKISKEPYNNKDKALGYFNFFS
ncbi:MAG: hypothetical protein PHC34_06585 [Candidatus Gastranaerophilales bacterium]|nr:hypothetical protein [Candidatus Gastranaerophilales bacterium]